MRDLVRRISVSALPNPPSQIEQRERDLKAIKKQFDEAKRLATEGKRVVALKQYNEVLLVQREKMGQDHLDAATTLNEIGKVLMKLGQHFPALTAFKEALYIREEALGHGAGEVAETLTNITILLESVTHNEEQATEREERREVVRRRSLGQLEFDDLMKYDDDDSDLEEETIEQERRREMGLQSALETSRQLSAGAFGGQRPKPQRRRSFGHLSSYF